LFAGGQAPDRNSPWWQFYQLSRVARAGAARNVPVIRERWATFQNEMFESAYQLAVEGKRLSDEGETAAAAQLLTGYMANNTHRMMNELEALLLDLQESKMQAVL
jgi:dipeptidase